MEAIRCVRISCPGQDEAVSFTRNAERELEAFLSRRDVGVHYVEVELRTGMRVVLGRLEAREVRRRGVRQALAGLLQRRMDDHRRVAADKASVMRSLEALGFEVEPSPRGRYKANRERGPGAWGAAWNHCVEAAGLPVSWQVGYAA